ncbi:uncharacterized protein [Rutidosis leptorrhynchoides]|uniref:uncharacterized protein n=1 Tax=Rutidosis leptorrhynchoides TaxID=125765 RepID=UPI003A99B092
MVKPKLKQHSNKIGIPNDPNMDELVQDGWVVVKKQIVTIWIPPLPITEQCAIPNPGPTPSQPMVTEEIDHISSPQPGPPLMLEYTMPLATTKPITTSSSPPKLNHNVTPHNYQPNRCKTVKVCSASKTRKCYGHLINGHMLVNPKMRALNLERKINRAGGLNSWLLSLGLGQFVKIFRCQRVGKVQLMNLTMKKLKDMGVHAVGPRRKLMHAIDCLW